MKDPFPAGGGSVNRGARGASWLAVGGATLAYAAAFLALHRIVGGDAAALAAVPVAVAGWCVGWRGGLAAGLLLGFPLHVGLLYAATAWEWAAVRPEVTAIVPILLLLAAIGASVGRMRELRDRVGAQDRELQQRSSLDPLTCLPNRAAFVEGLGRATAQAARQEQSVAVLFLDLDRFKVVNDSLGTEAGEHLLSAVAKRLQLSVRRGDTPARVAGDQFAVLMEHVADPREATTAATRILDQLATSFRVGGREVFVSAHVGIALSAPGEGDTPAVLLREAHEAMVCAKEGGTARYAFFDASIEAAARERLDLEADLRRAIEREEFLVYYQPKVELATGKVSGVEALIRWEHPARGIVSPAEFIPLAEEMGQILPLGQWVLREACSQVAAWQRQYPNDPPMRVCVNLSARQFQHPVLAEQVEAVLRETGLAPRTLVLEIPEGVLMEATEQSVGTQELLRQMGVRLAVDDFGTGYSYLKRFPVDTLKIDRSFVDGLGRSSGDTAVVSAVIALAGALGIAVTAEGVESAEQLELLRRMGCESGQGYLFAKPLDSEAAGALLAKYTGALSGELSPTG